MYFQIANNMYLTSSPSHPVRLALLFLLLVASALLFVTVKQKAKNTEEEQLLQERLIKQKLEQESPLTLLDDLYAGVDNIHKETAEFVELGALLDEIRHLETEPK